MQNRNPHGVGWRFATLAIGFLALIVVAGPFASRALAVCSCPSQGDVDGDLLINVSDLVAIFDVVTNGNPVVQDPDCPVSREDFNADGYVDARDIAGILDMIFNGGSPPQPPCDCISNPSLCDPVVDPNPGAPGNSVIVESKTVFVGETGVTIGVRLTNDVDVREVVVPLVVREIDAGAFITSAQQNFADRLESDQNATKFPNQYADPDGSCENGLSGGFGTITYSRDFAAHPVVSSPEGFLYFAFDVFTTLLTPGTDVTGSIVLTVDVTDTPGSFEIDTTCVDPANHLLFVANDVPAHTPIVPAFTKGVITIVPNTPPVALCQDVTVTTSGNCEGGGSVDAGSYDPDGGPVTLSQMPVGPYPLGTTPVTLVVTDNQGASDTCQANVIVEDQTPPTIVCPGDITMNVPPVYSGAVVAFEATATDECPGTVTIVSNPPSGGFFPVGTNEVICTATDAAGNTSQCSFIITVEAVCFDRYADVNCDGFTDAQDLATIIDIIYFGASPPPPCTTAP